MGGFLPGCLPSVSLSRRFVSSGSLRRFDAMTDLATLYSAADAVSGNLADFGAKRQPSKAAFQDGVERNGPNLTRTV
jgi:hypothetical protein